MANIEFFALTGSISIKGDNAAARTITFGQQVTNSDIITIDTATLSFDGTTQFVAPGFTTAGLMAAATFTASSTAVITGLTTCSAGCNVTGLMAATTITASSTAVITGLTTCSAGCNVTGLMAATTITASSTAVITGLTTCTAGVTAPIVTSVNNNEMYGNGAGASLVAGTQNAALGKDALLNITGGDGNVGMGFNAGAGIVDGNSNMVLGSNALETTDLSECVAIGVDALRYSGTGAANLVGIGYRALKGSSITPHTGQFCTAVGNLALSEIEGATWNNTAVGAQSMQACTDGAGNTAVGKDSLNDLLGGDNNLALGNDTGSKITTGSSNTLLGTGVGNLLTTESNVLRIHNAGGSAVPTITGDMSTRQISINNATVAGMLNVTVGASDALTAMILDQLDTSETFIDYVATSAGSVANPLSSWTTGNTIQGFAKIRVNGTDRYMPFYDAPTS